MSHELTNLLPEDRRASLKKEYLLRLGTLTAIMLALILVVHGVLLAPSYLYLQEQIAIGTTHRAQLSAERAASGYEALTARLTAFSTNATQLLELQSAPQASSVFEAVLNVPRPGIVLSSFSFTRPQTKDDGRLVVSGIASTRESLQQYVAALRVLSFVKNADLPLSSYAKESEIPFAITLTGPLTP